MRTDIQLHPFSTADAVPLLALFKDTVRRINSRDYSSEQIAAWASHKTELDAWTARFAGRFVVVAERQQQLVGFADLEPDGYE